MVMVKSTASPFAPMGIGGLSSPLINFDEFSVRTYTCNKSSREESRFNRNCNCSMGKKLELRIGKCKTYLDV
jgi:hypothetical protein